MIEYKIIVREHGKTKVIEEETASGNTERTAQAAKATAVRQLDWQYPPETYEIKVTRIRST